MARTQGYDSRSYWMCPRCRKANMHYSYACNVCNYSMLGIRDYKIHTETTASSSTIQIGIPSPKTEETKINKLKLLLK